jgi:hypothetical protein
MRKFILSYYVGKDYVRKTFNTEEAARWYALNRTNARWWMIQEVENTSPKS